LSSFEVALDTNLTRVSGRTNVLPAATEWIAAARSDPSSLRNEAAHAVKNRLRHLLHVVAIVQEDDRDFG
jgi:hypothetical protein